MCRKSNVHSSSLVKESVFSIHTVYFMCIYIQIQTNDIYVSVYIYFVGHSTGELSFPYSPLRPPSFLSPPPLPSASILLSLQLQMPFEVRHGKLDFCFNFMYRTPSSYLIHSSEFLAPEAMFLSVCSFLLGLTSAVCALYSETVAT